MMAIGRSFGSSCIRSVAARLGYRAVVASVALTTGFTWTGCASLLTYFEAYDPGVEIRFPGATSSWRESSVENSTLNTPAPVSRVVAAPDIPAPPVQRLLRGAGVVAVSLLDQSGATLVSRPLIGIADHGDTKYTLIPGRYAFEYDEPIATRVFGVVDLYPVLHPRAREFIRLGSIPMTPGGGGRPSVLSKSDLDRARNGDVVSKVVFMANLPAIRDRLDDIDRGLRELDRVRTSLEEQRQYWDYKLRDRRSNARHSSDYGWGVDVPAIDLEILQMLVGPERYHWHRVSEAEDQVRTYEEKVAQLDLPQRRLTEEEHALKQILNAPHVIHRSTDRMILVSSMIRPYHDPVDEVIIARGIDVWADEYWDKRRNELDDWIGPWGRVHFPYWYSSLSMAGMAPAIRPVAAPSMALTANIGEVLLVVRIGARRPIELGGHSWASTR